MKHDDNVDPKGLIFEAYRIEGISASQCRSIFLDWALSLPVDQETGKALRILIERHGESSPDHPMTHVLHDGLTPVASPRRRGGWRSKARN